MLVSIAKAAAMLGTGKHEHFITTDRKVAIAPLGRADVAISSIDALNMMIPVVKPESAGDTPEQICAELERLAEEIQSKPVELTAEQKRAAAYRAIRGDGS